MALLHVINFAFLLCSSDFSFLSEASWNDLSFHCDVQLLTHQTWMRRLIFLPHKVIWSDFSFDMSPFK